MRERYDPIQWTYRQWASRKRSRAVLWFGAFAIAIAAIVPILEMLDTADDEDRLASLLPFMILLIVPTMSPFGRSRLSIGAQKEPDFDEHERAILNRASARSHTWTIGLILMSFIWFHLASLKDWPMPTTAMDWSSWGFGLVSIALTLPVLFAEIMVPLPPEAEEEDFA